MREIEEYSGKEARAFPLGEASQPEERKPKGKRSLC
jgi:hypothetical protein